VQTAKYEALIRKPVRDLAEELDPDLFWQIHRATLVNVNAIEGVTRDIRGRHLVLVKDRPDKLEVSRSFLHLFKQM
jgi:DNA-binding LytR/AlgR family response regulator